MSGYRPRRHARCVLTALDVDLRCSVIERHSIEGRWGGHGPEVQRGVGWGGGQHLDGIGLPEFGSAPPAPFDAAEWIATGRTRQIVFRVMLRDMLAGPSSDLWEAASGHILALFGSSCRPPSSGSFVQGCPNRSVFEGVGAVHVCSGRVGAYPALIAHCRTARLGEETSLARRLGTIRASFLGRGSIGGSPVSGRVWSSVAPQCDSYGRRARSCGPDAWSPVPRRAHGSLGHTPPLVAPVSSGRGDPHIEVRSEVISECRSGH